MTARPRPMVTVVVASYRRASLLPRLVAALAAQTYPHDRFRLVIVDDASPDDTADVVAALTSTAPFEIELVTRPRNGGPAAARNDGWRRANDDYIAFTDDDCVPDPHWLERGVTALDEGADVVAGRTVPDPAQRHLLGPFTRTIDSGDGRFVQTCNVFYRRRDLVALDGFEERLRCGEDLDLALRTQERGRRLVHVPEALVLHDVRPASVRATLRETLRWRDIPYLVRRHPQTRSLFHGRVWWKRSHPPTTLALASIVTAATLRRPWLLVGMLPWLRFRLVTDAVTTDRVEQLRTLPAVFAVDALEVAVIGAGAARHRTVML